jgi:hypothetical protein
MGVGGQAAKLQWQGALRRWQGGGGAGKEGVKSKVKEPVLGSSGGRLYACQK